MIDLTKYTEFKEEMFRIGQLRYKFKPLESLIDVNKIDIIYPKRMYIDNKDINLFVFTNDYIYSILFYPEIKSVIYKKADIQKIAINLHGTSDPDYELIITFKYGDEIRIYNVEDTNEDWRWSFSEYLLKVYKYLIDEKV